MSFITAFIIVLAIRQFCRYCRNCCLSPRLPRVGSKSKSYRRDRYWFLRP
jgi:hypothetical protein